MKNIDQGSNVQHHEHALAKLDQEMLADTKKNSPTKTKIRKTE